MSEASLALIQRALRLVNQRYQEMQREQDAIRVANLQLLDQDLSGNALAKKIHDIIKQDEQQITEFNIGIDRFGDKTRISWPTRTNKLAGEHGMLSGALELATEETVGVLWDHKPSRWDNVFYDIPVLGRATFWGTPLSSNFTTALLTCYGVCAKVPIYDVCAKPSSLALNAITYQESTMPYRPTLSGLCNYYRDGVLVVPHSGFGFGKGRLAKDIPDQDLFCAHDCSSWIASITKCPYAWSTLDALYFIRKEKGVGVVSAQWDRYFDMKQTYTCGSTQAAQVGDVLLMRTFRAGDDIDKEPGISGHVGLVIGVLGDRVRTLRYPLIKLRPQLFVNFYFHQLFYKMPIAA